MSPIAQVILAAAILGVAIGLIFVFGHLNKKKNKKAAPPSSSPSTPKQPFVGGSTPPAGSNPPFVGDPKKPAPSPWVGPAAPAPTPVVVPVTPDTPPPVDHTQFEPSKKPAKFINKTEWTDEMLLFMWQAAQKTIAEIGVGYEEGTSPGWVQDNRAYTIQPEEVEVEQVDKFSIPAVSNDVAETGKRVQTLKGISPWAVEYCFENMILMALGHKVTGRL